MQDGWICIRCDCVNSNAGIIELGSGVWRSSGAGFIHRGLMASSSSKSESNLDVPSSSEMSCMYTQVSQKI
jgi:hypothetical protein